MAMTEEVVVSPYSLRRVDQTGAKGKPVVGHHFIVGSRQHSTDFTRRASPPILLLLLSFILILAAILGLSYLGPIGGAIVLVLIVAGIVALTLRDDDGNWLHGSSVQLTFDCPLCHFPDTVQMLEILVGRQQIGTVTFHIKQPTRAVLVDVNV